MKRENPFDFLKSMGVSAIQIGSTKLDLTDMTMHIPEGKKKSVAKKKPANNKKETQ